MRGLGSVASAWKRLYVVLILVAVADHAVVEELVAEGGRWRSSARRSPLSARQATMPDPVTEKDCSACEQEVAEIREGTKKCGFLIPLMTARSNEKLKASEQSSSNAEHEQTRKKAELEKAQQGQAVVQAQHDALAKARQDVLPKLFRSALKEAAAEGVDEESLQVAPGAYYFKVGGASLYMHMSGGSWDGAKQTLYTCPKANNFPNCKWLIQESPTWPGYFYIKASDDDLYMQASGGSEDGGLTKLNQCDKAKDLWYCQWKFEPSPTREGHVYIKVSDKNLYLKAQGGPNYAAPEILRPCPKDEDDPSCQWSLELMPSLMQAVAKGHIRGSDSGGGGSVLANMDRGSGDSVGAAAASRGAHHGDDLVGRWLKCDKQRKLEPVKLNQCFERVESERLRLAEREKSFEAQANVKAATVKETDDGIRIFEASNSHIAAEVRRMQDHADDMTEQMVKNG